MNLIACRNSFIKKGWWKIVLIMKLTTIFLLAICMNAAAKGFGQKVSLLQTNAPLEKIFREIKKQTGYTFAYTRSLLKKSEAGFYLRF